MSTGEVPKRNFEEAKSILKGMAAEAGMTLECLDAISPGQWSLRYFFLTRGKITTSFCPIRFLLEDDPRVFRGMILADFWNAHARIVEKEAENGQASQRHGESPPRA